MITYKFKCHLSIPRPGKRNSVFQSRLRSWVKRTVKTILGPVGPPLIRRVKSLLEGPGFGFPRPEVVLQALEMVPSKVVPYRKCDRAGGPRVLSTHRFRVLFVVRPGTMEAACTRYRGYNVMEALRLAGVATLAPNSSG